MIGLDVAGIDFICPDIASPVRETGGAICEVNAAPGFRMHTHPTVGEPQFIAKPVVDLLFPPGRPVAGADRRRHRHQRQDDDVADDRAHLQGPRPQGRHDLDRRRRHRRAARHQGRRVRPALGPDGAAEPARRLRRHGGRPRRHPARGPGLRPQRRRRRHQRRARPPRACAASTPSSSSPTSRPSSSRRCRATGSPCSTPTTRWCARCAAAARAAIVWFTLERARQRGARVHRRPLPPRWPGRRARADRPRRHDRHQARAPLRCSSPGPTCCPRPSAARPGSTSPTRWRRPVRRSPPAPPLHDIRQGLRTFTTIVLPLPRPDEPRSTCTTSTSFVDYCHNARRHAGARRVRRALRRAEGRAGRPRPRPRGSA